MVEVFIDNKGFTLTGHANYDVPGKDIVCSAISTLSQTIAIMLQKECDAHVISEEEVLFVTFDNYQVKEKVLMSTLIEGLKNVETEYPKNVKLSIRSGM